MPIPGCHGRTPTGGSMERTWKGNSMVVRRHINTTGPVYHGSEVDIELVRPTHTTAFWNLSLEARGVVGFLCVELEFR